MGAGTRAGEVARRPRARLVLAPAPPTTRGIRRGRACVGPTPSTLRPQRIQKLGSPLGCSPWAAAPECIFRRRISSWAAAGGNDGRLRPLDDEQRHRRLLEEEERQQKLEAQRQRAREVLAHQANKEYFDSSFKEAWADDDEEGATEALTRRGEHEGRDTSDLVNVKAASRRRRRRLRARRCPRTGVASRVASRSFFPHNVTTARARGQGHAF